jgi:hypothetical protein
MGGGKPTPPPASRFAFAAKAGRQTFEMEEIEKSSGGQRERSSLKGQTWAQRSHGSQESLNSVSRQWFLPFLNFVRFK